MLEISGIELVHSTITEGLSQFSSVYIGNTAETTETSDDILDDKVCGIEMLIHIAIEKQKLPFLLR